MGDAIKGLLERLKELLLGPRLRPAPIPVPVDPRSPRHR